MSTTYYQRNRDKMLARQKARYYAKRDALIEYQTTRYAQMSEKLREYQRRYSTRNRSAMIRRVDTRRKMLRSNGGRHTRAEWESMKAACAHTCLSCGIAEPEIKLPKDHIVPVLRGGTDNIENIQPLCRRCNIKKRNRIYHYARPHHPENERGHCPVARPLSLKNQ